MSPTTGLGSIASTFSTSPSALRVTRAVKRPGTAKDTVRPLTVAGGGPAGRVEAAGPGEGPGAPAQSAGPRERGADKAVGRGPELELPIGERDGCGDRGVA